MENQYRIRIFSSFCASENCKDIYERLCESVLMENYGPNNKIYITNGDDYSHVIILNTAMPQLNPNIPRKNVIGMAFEPPRFLNLTPQFVEYAKRHIGKYYIGQRSEASQLLSSENFGQGSTNPTTNLVGGFQPPDKFGESEGLGNPFVERYSHMWYNPPLKEKPEKTKLMSLMVSEKTGESGHIYRHKLVNKILETELPIDIYGRGCKFYSFLEDNRVKGEFTEIEPYEKYKFHISIENLETNHYFSEKIMNPLLTSTVPIYLGCRNILNYFGESVIVLSGNIDRDMDLLRNVCREPEKYEKEIDIEKVKDCIYLLRNIDELFST